MDTTNKLLRRFVQQLGEVEQAAEMTFGER
jgi:hypothetical protein